VPPKPFDDPQHLGVPGFERQSFRIAPVNLPRASSAGAELDALGAPARRGCRSRASSSPPIWKVGLPRQARCTKVSANAIDAVSPVDGVAECFSAARSAPRSAAAQTIFSPPQRGQQRRARPGRVGRFSTGDVVVVTITVSFHGSAI